MSYFQRGTVATLIMVTAIACATMVEDGFTVKHLIITALTLVAVFCLLIIMRVVHEAAQ